MKDVKIMLGCMVTLTVIAVGVVLHAAQSVFLPLFIAWVLSYILAPGVRFMTSRLHVPVVLTTILLMAIMLYVVSQAGSFLSQMLIGSADRFVEYYQQFSAIWRQFSEKYNITATYLDGVNWAAMLRSYLISLSSSVITLISKSVMVIVFLMFILFGSPYVEYKMRRAFPRKNVQVMGILETISHQIGRFLTVMTLISAATGVLIWFGLSLIGVDFASTWGALAFCLNFIPTVGSIVASIPPILISIVQFYPQSVEATLGIAPQVIMTVVLILCVQLTIGNIITPKVMGDSMNLSPVVILTSLLMWSWLWGVAGALLSMPIAAIIKIVCDNVDQLNMVGVLMSSGQAIKKEITASEKAARCA